MSLVADTIMTVLEQSVAHSDIEMPDSFDSSDRTSDQTPPDGFVSNRLIHRALESIRKQFDDEPTGLAVAEYFDISHLGVVARVAHHCETLREAVCRYLEYQSLIHPEVAHHEQREERSWDGIIVKPTDDPTLTSSQEMRVSFGFAFALNWMRHLLDNPGVEAEAVHFVHRDATHRETYAEHFGCPVELGCEQNRLWFDSELFDCHITGGDSASRPYLEELAERRIDELEEESDTFEDFVSRVSEVLRDRLASETCSQEEVAREIGMSRRTLQRRLREHDYAYTELRDEIREERALDLLADPDQTLRSIAYELGYNQVSSFHRAFKRWTGRSPSKAREHILQHEAD
jgi:AraC-like DNA-binding protein